MTYTVTIREQGCTPDVVTYNDPFAAVSAIQFARHTLGLEVTYTGDPFADAVTLACAEG